MKKILVFNGYTNEEIEDIGEIIKIATTESTRIQTTHNGNYYLFPAIHPSKDCKCSACHLYAMNEYWEKVNGEN